MAAPNRWAVREAAIVTFYNLATGAAIVTLKTLKMTEVQTTGETVYARGGRGNAKLVGFTSDREARMTLQDAIFDNYALAMLTGNAIAEGAETVDMMYEFTIPADTPYTVTVPKTVSAVRSVHFIDTDGVTILAPLTEVETAPATGEYSIAGDVLTFAVADAGLKAVIYYATTTDATAKTVKVTADKFGGTFKVVANVLIRDEDTKDDFYGQFVAFNAKIEDDFSFNFSPDGDPSVLDIPLEILKSPENEDMWQLVIFDESLAGA